MLFVYGHRRQVDRWIEKWTQTGREMDTDR